jgi:argininosuccinate lyase
VTRTSTWRSNAAPPSWPGDVGAKIHTGRSRNDQVATTCASSPDARSRSPSASGLVDVAGRSGLRQRDAYLPGYTHLQRAQPVLLAHHLNAHAWSLLRDVDRLWTRVSA